MGGVRVRGGCGACGVGAVPLWFIDFQDDWICFERQAEWAVGVLAFELALGACVGLNVGCG